MSDIDLAYSCVDAAGAASATTVVLNRLLRTRRDAPPQLKNLKLQTTAAKDTLEKLLSMIDCDTPAFQSEADTADLDGHLESLLAIFRDLQDHAAKVYQATRSIEKSTWTLVWPVAHVSASTAALKDKLGILAIYIDGSRAPFEEQPSTKFRIDAVSPASKPSSGAASPSVAGSSQLITGPWRGQELSSWRSESSIIDDKARLHMRSLGKTAASLGSSHASTWDHERSSESTSAVESPPHYEEGERQLQQTQMQDEQDSELPQGRRSVASSSQASDVPSPVLSQCQSPQPQQQQLQVRRQMQPYQRTLPSTQSLQRNISSATTPAIEGMKTAMGVNKFSIISARKMKSTLFLTKPTLFEDEKAANHGDADIAQGDELFPDRFRDRVTNYSRGITPAWAPMTIPSKKKKKPDKNIYRNRFTNTNDLDVSPDHLTSHFKILEKDIWDAILHRRPERVQEIMEHKWHDNPVVEKQDGVTALHVAAALGQCRIVKILLSVGANPNAGDRYGVTPLHYAADFGCPHCVHLLMSAGAQVDREAVKQNIKTPLRYAVKMGNVGCAAALLERGAHVYMQTSSPDDTLLYSAVSTGSVALCDLLLKAGANPKESFEILALAASKSLELLACLVVAGADINLHGPPAPPSTEKSKKAAAVAAPGPGDTLLHRYVALDDMKMVEFLLSSLKASPDVAGEEGRYPLHIAVTPSTTTPAGLGSNSLLITQTLIAHGADLEVRNGLGQTPLQLAVLWGRADATRLLCSSGASIDAADNTGLTPWAETQKRDYASRPGPTPRAGPWSGGDYRSVAEIVSIERQHVREVQQKQMELHQHQHRVIKGISPPPTPLVSQHQHVMAKGAQGGHVSPQRGAVELPPAGIDSRPVQEVHGESASPRLAAATVPPVLPTQDRSELPA